MTRRSLAAALVLLAACGESAAGPVTFEGRYELRASDGSQLPATFVAGQTLQRGTLDVVGADTLRVTLGLGGPNGGPVTDQRYTFRYQRVGDSLVVAFQPGAGGRVSGATVRLRIGVPRPPSLGLGLSFHDLTFQR